MTAFEFWQSVANTPFWTYLFFLYILAFSYRTTKPQIVPFKTLQFAPIGIAIISVSCMFSFLHVNVTNLGYWVAMLVTGLGIGWLQYRIKNVKAIKTNNTLHIPGTYLFVAFICTMIFAKFYYGYVPSYTNFHLSLASVADIYSDKIMALLGLLGGLLSGRLMYAKKVMRDGPFHLAA